MVPPGINGDPFSLSAVAVMAEAEGGDGGVEQAGGAEDEGGGAGAIVGGIKFRGGMPGAVDIGHAGDAIGGGDGDLDIGGRRGGGDGIAILQNGLADGAIEVDVGGRGDAAGEEQEGEKEEALHGVGLAMGM